MHLVINYLSKHEDLKDLRETVTLQAAAAADMLSTTAHVKISIQHENCRLHLTEESNDAKVANNHNPNNMKRKW